MYSRSKLSICLSAITVAELRAGVTLLPSGRRQEHRASAHVSQAPHGLFGAREPAPFAAERTPWSDHHLGANDLVFDMRSSFCARSLAFSIEIKQLFHAI
jgi:hypothetical protein